MYLIGESPEACINSVASILVGKVFEIWMRIRYCVSFRNNDGIMKFET